MKRSPYGVGVPCPDDAAHGPLLDIDTPQGTVHYCPHQAHDGRPRTHPAGFTARTDAIFRPEERKRGQ